MSEKPKMRPMSVITRDDGIPSTSIIDGSQISIDITSMGSSDRKITPYRHASEIPPGAVIMSRHQMINCLGMTVKNWKPRTEVLSYSVGLGALVGISGITGTIMNVLYRQRLKITTNPNVSTAPLLVIGPGMSFATHLMLVQMPILMKEPECPICHITRSMTLQFATGFALPLSMVIISTTASARVSGTMDVPNLYHIREMGTFLRRTMRPLWFPAFAALFLTNVITAGVVATKDITMVDKIWQRMGIFDNTAESQISINSRQTIITKDLDKTDSEDLALSE